MTLRRLPVVLLSLLLIGCSSSPTPEKPPAAADPAPSPKPGANTPAAPAGPTTPTSNDPTFDRMDAALDTDDRAQIVARQAEAYARSIEQAMASRGTPAPAALSAASQVQWVEPADFSLDPVADAAPRRQALAQPVIEPRPTEAAAPARSSAPAARSAEPAPAPAPAVDAASIADTDPSVAGANQGMMIVPDASRGDGAGAASARPASAAGEAVAAMPVRPGVGSALVAPSGSPSPGVTPIATDPLEQKLLQQIRDYPRDVSAHLDYQLHLLVRDEPVPNLSAMSSLPAEDRELIVTFIDGLTNFRNAVRADANLLLSRKVRPLVEMADRLRSRADLSVPVLALCRKVEGFGRYDAFDPPRFVAGKPQQAIIYCEVDNFASQLNDGKMWETRLSMEGVLYTEGGLPVWNVKTDTLTDLARNRRRDFFLVKVITLSEQLTIGRYLLKVTIVDQQSNRVAEASIPIQIVSNQP
jgi:hypothetical protein